MLLVLLFFIVAATLVATVGAVVVVVNVCATVATPGFVNVAADVVGIVVSRVIVTQCCYYIWVSDQKVYFFTITSIFCFVKYR